jgi:hypothetical protein
VADTSHAITVALRENGERASEWVRWFVQEVGARQLPPTPMGYVIYRVERPDRSAPETIRLRAEEGDVYYEGESASLRDAYSGGLPFYVMDARLWAGRFPPAQVVGEECSVAAISAAVDLLCDLLTRYLESGAPATFL